MLHRPSNCFSEWPGCILLKTKAVPVCPSEQEANMLPTLGIIISLLLFLCERITNRTGRSMLWQARPMYMGERVARAQ